VTALAVLLVVSDRILFGAGVLGLAATLGLGTGSIFQLVPEHFSSEVGAVTGLVSAIGGLGGFFPPIVLGVLEQAIGSYAIGFVLLSAFALGALLVDLAVFLLPGRHGSPPSQAAPYQVNRLMR